MSTPPQNPKIYHITPVDNLPSIIADGMVMSDAAMIARGGPATSIGMSSIKQRRLILPVDCHPGDHVGDYVPFYFCPRSVMLYVIHCANHPSLTYLGGQQPIVHLEADLHTVIDWADEDERRWAFSLSNAGAVYTEFRSKVSKLKEIDWKAVANPIFRDPQVKEAKQAEFLVRDSFPWRLVEQVGVCSARYEKKVKQMLSKSTHKPAVSVRQNWYF